MLARPNHAWLNKGAVSGVIVALIIGTAIGTIAFPRTNTTTLTQTTTTTQIITFQVTKSYTGNGSGAQTLTTVTLTAIIVDVYYLSGGCTTVNGTAYVTYTQFPGNQLTTVVTIHNGTLPQEYVATVTTDYQSNSASFTTQPFSGAC